MPTVTPRKPSPDTPQADPLAAKLTELQQHLTQRRQLLAQLDAQRAQVQAAILRLEGGCAVLDELLQPAATE